MPAKPTLEARLDALARTVATLATTVSALVPTSAPAVVKAESPVHVGPSGKPDGRIFPCTATPACGRMLRSEGRAAIHGVAAGGHEAAKA